MAHSKSSLTADAVYHEAASYGFTPTLEACSHLATYMSMLTRWNKAMNLVGTKTWQETFRTLIIDSFYLADFMASLNAPIDKEQWETWDLGAGAGLPGIPLRALWTDGQYWLVESRQKRALFLTTVLAHAMLAKTHVFNGRVEQFMPKRPAAHCIISRAFMPWDKLLQLVSPFLHEQGYVILLTRTGITPPPPWRVRAQTDYDVLGTTRHILALQATSAV